jgi:hypothetical protein
MVEQPNDRGPAYRDSAETRAAAADLAYLLAGQLLAVGNDITAGHCPAWQMFGIAGRLDRLRVDVEFLRKEVAKLSPPTGGGDE